MSYRAPVRDLAFTLAHVAEAERLAETGAFPDFDADLAQAVIEAAGRTAEDILAPLNRPGDLAGATYANGAVTAAPGFRDAYKTFAEGGWTGLAADPAFGGQGLPKALEQAAFETVHAANMAFGLCPMLSLAAIEALHAHGTPEQKARYLPRLISGEWTGTMNLTEPQSGSDLGTIRTMATPDSDGGWSLTGQKIFITWGDHDCTDNIVHFVLARTPGAPEGTRGISLFLAPKILVGDDGAPGARNGLRPVGIEHKLGINASPTCVMAFEGAKAELVGELHQGLAHMFTMMNAARLAVGVEGVAIAERAYQGALAYAHERRQGRSAWTGETSARIFDHPDVRRMLAVSKSKIDAARSICLSAAVAADMARHAPDGESRARWKLREDLFVPIAKAWSTEVGVEVASVGVQIHGGMGFIEETGAAQHYRDARIAPIYEGTNGIQAIDLVGRKLAAGDGAAIRDLAADIRATLRTLETAGRLAEPAARLAYALEAVEAATRLLLARRALESHADVLAAADSYLTLVAETIGGWMLAKAAVSAERLLEAKPNDAWLEGKAALFNLYAEHVLARVPSRLAAIAQGDSVLSTLSGPALNAS